MRKYQGFCYTGHERDSLLKVDYCLKGAGDHRRIKSNIKTVEKEGANKLYIYIHIYIYYCHKY